MTQVVSTPNCDSNVGRQVKDFMYVKSNVSPKLSKRIYQAKMNSFLKETEVELDADLVEYFKTKTDLILKDSKIYHSSHLLSKDLRIANFRQHANGLTFIVFEFENHTPLFYFTICSKQDNFSRLEGRLYVKRKALHKLTEVNKDKVLVGGIHQLYTYETRPEYVDSVTPLKIGNWIVKHAILPEKEKQPIYVNPLKYQDEDKLLAMAKELLSQKYNIDPTTIRLHTQYIRFYKTNLFSHGLVCTPEWFKELNQEGKELLSTGGYTTYAMVGTLKDSDKKEVFVTYARCSEEEAYVKSYGRKQCLINIIKNQLDAYKLETPIDNFNTALLSLTERKLQHAINIAVESDKENGLVKI